MKQLGHKILLVLLVTGLVLAAVGPAYADTVYVVQSGDTLFLISVKFGVSLSALMTANGITNPNLIYVGQRLTIPGAGPSVSTSGSTYVVRAGDTLAAIAAKFKISISAIMTANNLTNPNLIYIGQRLIIPGLLPMPTVKPATLVPGTAYTTYTVQRGDTLASIAQKFGVSLWSIAAANGVVNVNRIYVGQRLIIPGQGYATQPAATAMPPATSAPTQTPKPYASATFWPTATSRPPTFTPLPTTTATVPTTVKTSTPTPSQRDVQGQLTLISGCGHAICFRETIVNNSSRTIPYSFIGVKAVSQSGSTRLFQTSWSGNLSIGPGCTGPTGTSCGGPWVDGMDPPANTYTLSLEICFASYDACRVSVGWETLYTIATPVTVP